MAHPFDVIVVGMGSMGSAATYSLARRGRRVLGLDARRPPHDRGSHHGESRIIRKAYFEHPAYVPLVERAYALWDELANASGRELLVRTGGLMIGRNDGELVSGALASARKHGLAHAELTRGEVMSRFPFRLDPDMSAVWEPDAGILFPETCIGAFLDGAAAAGADVRFDEPVTEWSCTAGTVRVVTKQGRYEAGALVLAGGIDMPALLSDLRDALTVERQVIAHFRPALDAGRLRPQAFPIYCLEERDGAFYYGFPDLGRGCKAGRHHGGATGERALTERTVSQRDIDDIRAFLARHLPSVNGEVVASTVCFYTNTPDFHFVLDRHVAHEQVVVASACSGHGFKFSPVGGEIVADFVEGVKPAFDLSMFGMSRLLAAD